MSSALYVGPDSQPDKYRLVRSVGRGGEATLYLAEVTLAGQTEPVVVKVLNSDVAADSEQFDELSGRWNEQAELLRFINRLGVVGVREHFEGVPEHRAGESGEYTDRALYLVMNYVEGLDLRDWRAEHAVEGPKGQREVLRHLEQIAEVLDWLHSGRATPSRRAVVHGDLSPGNIMVSEDGQATLVDFGLSKIAARHMTAKPWFTPGYAAPEIFNGEYSAATDRYAFGAIVYFALSGAEPPPAPEQLRERFAELPVLATAGPQQRERITAMFSAEPSERPAALDWIKTLRSVSTSIPWSGPVSNPQGGAAAGAAGAAAGGAAGGAAAAAVSAPWTGPAEPTGGPQGGQPPGPPDSPGRPADPPGGAGAERPAAAAPQGPPVSGPPPQSGPSPQGAPAGGGAPADGPGPRPPAGGPRQAPGPGPADSGPQRSAAPAGQGGPPQGPPVSGPPPQSGPSPQGAPAGGLQPGGPGPQRPVGGMRGTPPPPPPPQSGPSAQTPPPSFGAPGGPGPQSGPQQAWTAPMAAVSGPQQPPKKRSRKPKLIGLAILVVLCLAAGAGGTYWVLGRGTQVVPGPQAAAGASSPSDEPGSSPMTAQEPDPGPSGTAGASPSTGSSAGADAEASTGGGEEYLATHDPVDSDDGFENANATINTESYSRALTGSTSCGNYPDWSEYNLNRSWSTFTSTVGISDDSPSDSTVVFTVIADGEKVATQTAKLGEELQIEADVEGALRLRLEIEPGADCDYGAGDATAVWADPVLRE
ncbi:serine/threonine protein kinase [Spinactinospora alkalitolerans]|uniref:non-specific serine/threonine protein kinase n=1 Tax=Spinactinospora alkalitolerans TaxID=687207 RepID=A0A852TYG9_9ACTN|nr:NPCBM/NEW2 domain-containing protein [Spinactinospora alkalitolerans]NYE48385.1 serine/threonine protein kinase [Spinactinospora alkalitolerans]